jgi:hypothetical protein
MGSYEDLLRKEDEMGRRLGFPDFGSYFRHRRSQGWGYDRIAKETGLSKDCIRGARRRIEGDRPSRLAG